MEITDKGLKVSIKMVWPKITLIPQNLFGRSAKFNVMSLKKASLGVRSKFLMYVTKTCVNLTTYSRKLGNYVGTIIFEIDIMKNSSPINFDLCQT